MYPHVAAGFTDSNAYLRELTLKSMLVLAPMLSQKTLNQSLLKYLAKLQARTQPRHVQHGSWPWGESRLHFMGCDKRQALHLECMMTTTWLGAA